MALLGEEVVEEWLNRQGYFTIRGIKLGVHEIDLLAVRLIPGGVPSCRHLEAQISTNPVAYISKVPKEIQKQRGIGPDSRQPRLCRRRTSSVWHQYGKGSRHWQSLSS